MKKKLLSAVLALCLVFGSTAALPQSFVAQTASISVSAASETKVSGNYKYKILDDGTAEITAYTGSASVLTIPETLGGKYVSSIGEGAFIMNSTLTSVTLPYTVTEIGVRAFLYCGSLKTVNLSRNLVTIGKEAFSQSRLTSVTIPATVKRIGEGAFRDCQLLEKVTVNSGVNAEIENYAFNKCTALTSVDLGCTVSAIGSFAFEGCKALTKLTIPASVTSISQRAFKDCTKLTSVDLGNGVKSIASGAFINCSALSSARFGTSLETIGDSAFEGCKSLTTIILKPSTKQVGISAFAGCDALTKAALTGVEVIGVKAFSYCPNLSEVVFCDNLRAIGEDAFINCPDYKDAYIPADSLNEIQEHAFGYGYNSEKKEYGKLKDFTIHSKTGRAKTYAYQYEFKFEEITSQHKCSYLSVTVPPTCTQEGYTIKVCKQCGETQTTDTVKALYHKGTGWTTTAYNVSKSTSTQTGYCSVCGETVTKTTPNAVTRLKGSGRYATAAAISKGVNPQTNSTVVLTNGYKFADALAGATLAKAYKDAPILLTDKDTLPADTLAEIKRLKATNVIILGGSGVVSSKVETALTKNGIKAANITRIKGSTRFETSIKIAKQLQSVTKTTPTEIFFVSSDKFADALSVSAIAAKKGSPIVYLPKTGSIDSSTAAYLKSVKGKIKNAYVIGGSGVIGADVMKAAGTALGLTVDKTIVRIKGSTKYDTCVAVNSKFASVLSGSAISVATGEDFPDALAGGVFAAVQRTPMFLAGGSLSANQKNYLKNKNASKIFVLGGSKSVPDTLVSNIAKACCK